MLRFDEGNIDGLSVGELLMQQLVATAEDASSIAQATADAAALSRAQYWLQILRDFRAADARDSTGEGSFDSNGTADATPAESVAVGGASGDEDTGNPEGVSIGWDGNDDVCASCGGEGELVCCDSCPRAYHMTTECLGGVNAISPVRISSFTSCFFLLSRALQRSHSVWGVGRMRTMPSGFVRHARWKPVWRQQLGKFVGTRGRYSNDRWRVCPRCQRRFHLQATVYRAIAHGYYLTDAMTYIMQYNEILSHHRSRRRHGLLHPDLQPR